MKLRIIKVLTLTAVVIGAGMVVKHQQGEILGRQVEALGDLVVTYLGLPLSGPIFEVTDMVPGDCETRSVLAENNGFSDTTIAVRSQNEVDLAGLSTQLSMVISEGGVDLYGGTSPTGPKQLIVFFADSLLPNGVELSTITGGSSATYDFEVCFDEAAGNPFQGTSVVFDLVFGELSTPEELPAECSELNGKIDKVITGTEGNDRLKGGPKKELILGLGGDDVIDAGAADDCVVGGAGNDRLNGGSAQDVVLGNEGEDRIDGGSGNDKVFGGEDNDRVKGGSGNDQAEGGGGDDTVSGDSGNDHLDGGEGNDRLSGNTGRDTCVAGEVLSSCEL